jgi:hypothetical protein
MPAFDGERRLVQALISWGDGSENEPGEIVTRDGTTSVEGSHEYRAVGRYRVVVSLADTDGHSRTVDTVAFVGTPGQRLAAGVYRTASGGAEASATQLENWAERIVDAGARAEVIREILSAPASRAHRAKQVYERILLRAPSEAELSHAGRMEEYELEERLVGGDEYFERRVASSPAAFAVAAYQDVLGRAPAPEEQARAIEGASSAEGRSRIAHELAISEEVSVRRIGLAAREFARRSATSRDIAVYLDKLDTDDEIDALSKTMDTWLFPNDAPSDAGTEDLPPEAIPASAVQLRSRLSDEDLDGFKARLRRQPQFANGDIYDHRSAAATTVAVWPDQRSDLQFHRQEWVRRKGLAEALVASPTGAGAAFFVSLGFVRAEAQRNFDAQPKRIDSDDGFADENGDVTLNSLEIIPVPPNQVITRVFGRIDVRAAGVSLGISIGFHNDITDTLTIEPPPNALPGETIIKCSSKQESFQSDGDKTALGFLAFFLPLPYAVGAGELAAKDQPQKSGVGCGVADGFEHAILVPPSRGEKILFNFVDDQMVYDDCIIARAHVAMVPRKPTIEIDGPRSLVVEQRNPRPGGKYSVRVSDLRADPPAGLSITWDADAKGKVISQGAFKTEVVFDIQDIPLNRAGGRTVRVTVIDQDGFTVSKSIGVSVLVVDKLPIVPPPLPRRPLQPEPM